MRTTVTLDDDVERLLRDAMRHSGKSFKEELNRALREGLAVSSKLPPPTPYRVSARPLQLRAGVDPASLNRLLDELDIEGVPSKGGGTR